MPFFPNTDHILNIEHIKIIYTLGTLRIYDQLTGPQIACIFEHLKYLIANSELTNEDESGSESEFEENSLSNDPDEFLAADSHNDAFPFTWPETIEERAKRYQSKIVNNLKEKVIALVAEPIDGW